MKFLATGSAGFVGRQIARDLSESRTKLYCSYYNSRPEFGTQAKMDNFVRQHGSLGRTVT